MSAVSNRVRMTVGTSAVEHHPFDPFPNRCRHVLGDHAAHGMTDQVELIYAKPIEDGEHLLGVMLDTIGRFEVGAVAEARKVGGDHVVSGGEVMQGLAPHSRSPEVSVHKHQRRTGALPGECKSGGRSRGHFSAPGNQRAAWGNMMITTIRKS